MNGFARSTAARMSTRRPTRLWPRVAGCASGSTSGLARVALRPVGCASRHRPPTTRADLAAVPSRLEASVSRPAAGAAEATPTATPPGSRRGRPRVAASSSTVGRLTSEPARGRRGRGGRSGGEESPKRGPRGPRRPGRVPLRSRSGRRDRGVPAVRGQPAAALEVGTISRAHIFRHVSRRSYRMQDPGPFLRGPIKGVMGPRGKGEWTGAVRRAAARKRRPGPAVTPPRSMRSTRALTDASTQARKHASG